jgi:NADP-dependent 3-hydroxy acid dehydrogenase YdfG
MEVRAGGLLLLCPVPGAAKVSCSMTSLLLACITARPGYLQHSISRVAVVGALAGGSVYCGTKHFLDAFTTAARHDLVGSNIRVTAISPG